MYLVAKLTNYLFRSKGSSKDGSDGDLPALAYTGTLHDDKEKEKKTSEPVKKDPDDIFILGAEASTVTEKTFPQSRTGNPSTYLNTPESSVRSAGLESIVSEGVVFNYDNHVRKSRGRLPSVPKQPQRDSGNNRISRHSFDQNSALPPNEIDPTYSSLPPKEGKPDVVPFPEPSGGEAGIPEADMESPYAVSSRPQSDVRASQLSRAESPYAVTSSRATSAVTSSRQSAASTAPVANSEAVYSVVQKRADRKRAVGGQDDTPGGEVVASKDKSDSKHTQGKTGDSKTETKDKGHVSNPGNPFGVAYG